MVGNFEVAFSETSKRLIIFLKHRSRNSLGIYNIGYVQCDFMRGVAWAVLENFLVWLFGWLVGSSIYNVIGRASIYNAERE